MELIEKLETRLLHGKWVRFGIFKCPCCLIIVERKISQGKRDKSCGCNQHAKYKYPEGNIYKTRLYNIWSLMKSRCFDTNNKDYHNYGGRGITICNEWLEFIPFRDWALNNGYLDNLTIDRRNNNLGYFPENCRWITSKENSWNRRTNKLSFVIASNIRKEYKENLFTRKELSIKYNVTKSLIDQIVNNKIWIDEKCL